VELGTSHKIITQYPSLNIHPEIYFTAESDEIAEIRKNSMRILSAALDELGGEILNFIVLSNTTDPPISKNKNFFPIN
jgi:hypothetical protein